jgi:hypothetical protein
MSVAPHRQPTRGSATQNHRPPVDKQPFFIETSSGHVSWRWVASREAEAGAKEERRERDGA